MATIRVDVLGPARLVVDGVEIPLKPLTIRLLIRLVAARGQPVPVGGLRRDVWAVAGGSARLERGDRTEVQKRILELRKLFDPERSGEGERVLSTERVFSGGRPESAYRLDFSPEQLDSEEFIHTLSKAELVPPAVKTELLTRALRLWRGAPLAEAGGAEYAEALRRRLDEAHQDAYRELIRLHIEFGRLEPALELSERMVAERPGDPEAVRMYNATRDRLRYRHGTKILQRDFPRLRSTIVINRGDLFEQHDANLVVGFTDTFDVAVGRDSVISRESVQGQLLERLYGGQAEVLDHELRRVLRTARPVDREARRDKPRGKLLRYPIGTAVPLVLDGRRIFATAYSRLGNDLVARSSGHDLRSSLKQLWFVVAQHGMYKPVAVPLLGAGLSRIMDLERVDLLKLIIDSFLQGCRDHSALAPELRIMLRPEDLERTPMEPLVDFVENLAPDGKREA